MSGAQPALSGVVRSHLLLDYFPASVSVCHLTPGMLRICLVCLSHVRLLVRTHTNLHVQNNIHIYMYRVYIHTCMYTWQSDYRYSVCLCVNGELEMQGLYFSLLSLT